MPHEIPWTVKVQSHPGSSDSEIRDEPDWTSGHQHRIGFRNRANRKPGITHDRDEYHEQVEKARKRQAELSERYKTGKLVNFRDVIKEQEVSTNTRKKIPF